MEKGAEILRELDKLNMTKRGHKVVDYSEDCEIAVYGINVPMLADCRGVARKCGATLDESHFFDMVIFSW